MSSRNKTVFSGDPQQYVEAIRRNKLSIYDRIKIGDPELWIPTEQLEQLLDDAMSGISLEKLPIRTRSKVVKAHICRALGYPVPSTFKKSQPRFPGQCFDTYVQKSNNLQIWNEAVIPSRRYVIVRVGEKNTITKVKVVVGNSLVELDTTGTLTQKFQARLVFGQSATELITDQDTERLCTLVDSNIVFPSETDPSSDPKIGQLFSISDLFCRLKPLVGRSFTDIGYDQERNRGAVLHRLVCMQLGYGNYRDGGQFPDIRHQLLEVKLQTSMSIDLGLVKPDSDKNLDVAQINDTQIRQCDVRYAVFYADMENMDVTLTNLFLITGEKFFTRFQQFQGNVLNTKLQIPLPMNFFD